MYDLAYHYHKYHYHYDAPQINNKTRLQFKKMHVSTNWLQHTPFSLGRGRKEGLWNYWKDLKSIGKTTGTEREIPSAKLKNILLQGEKIRASNKAPAKRTTSEPHDEAVPGQEKSSSMEHVRSSYSIENNQIGFEGKASVKIFRTNGRHPEGCSRTGRAPKLCLQLPSIWTTI